MKHDYHYSGKSSPEAFQHFEKHFLKQFPKPFRNFIRQFLSFKIVCDGCGDTVSMKKPHLAPDNRWRGTNWVHRGRLDFCGLCDADGTADRAIADGAKPLGAYTLE